MWGATIHQQHLHHRKLLSHTQELFMAAGQRRHIRPKETEASGRVLETFLPLIPTHSNIQLHTDCTTTRWNREKGSTKTHSIEATSRL